MLLLLNFVFFICFCVIIVCIGICLKLLLCIDNLFSCKLWGLNILLLLKCVFGVMWIKLLVWFINIGMLCLSFLFEIFC